MEKLIKLNSMVDALISALRNSQAEAHQLRKELEEVRAADKDKQSQISSLEIVCEEKDYRIITLQEELAKKDTQLEDLIKRIEDVLSTLPTQDQPTS